LEPHQGSWDRDKCKQHPKDSQHSSCQIKLHKSHLNSSNKFSPPFQRAGMCARACSEPPREATADAASRSPPCPLQKAWEEPARSWHRAAFTCVWEHGCTGRESTGRRALSLQHQRWENRQERQWKDHHTHAGELRAAHHSRRSC